MAIVSSPSKYDMSEIQAMLTKYMPTNMEGLTATKLAAEGFIKVMMDAKQVQNIVANKFVEKLIQNTPRKSGRLRFNWQAQVGGTNSNELLSTTKQYRDGDALNNAKLKIAKAKLGDKIFIFNNAPYAMKAELTGWKGTTVRSALPYGMLRKTLAQFEQIFNEAIAEVKAVR